MSSFLSRLRRTPKSTPPPDSAPRQHSDGGTRRSTQRSQQPLSQKPPEEISEEIPYQPSQQPPQPITTPSQLQQALLSEDNNRPRQGYPWPVGGVQIEALMQLPQGLPTSDQPTETSMAGPPPPSYGHSVPLVATPSVFGGLVEVQVEDDLWVVRGTWGVWGLKSTAGQSGRRSTKEMGVVTNLVGTIGDAPRPRVGHKNSLVDSVWVFGIVDPPTRGECNDRGLYSLNLITHDWTKVDIVGPAPLGRYGHAVGMCGNKLIVFGGQVDGEFSNDLWSLDLKSIARGISAWEQLTPAPGNEPPPPRTGHVLVTYENKIYIFGGTHGASHYNDTWCFDMSTRTWSELTCIGFIPISREGRAAPLVGDIMHVFRGRDVGIRDLTDLESLNISNRRWFTFQNMGPQLSWRSGHAMVTADGWVFVIRSERSELHPTEGDPVAVLPLYTNLLHYPGGEPHKREKSNSATIPPLQQSPAPRPGLTPSSENQSSSSPGAQEEARNQENPDAGKVNAKLARKVHEYALAQKAQGEAAGTLQEKNQRRAQEEIALNAHEAQQQAEFYQTPEDGPTRTPPASDEESTYDSAPEERGKSDARENEKAAPGITTLALNEMTTPQMLQCLVDYGCVDLTSAINPEKISIGMVVGGSFGDIWSGQLHNNTSIAIKVWRFTSLVEDRGKSLKRAMREICYWSGLDHPHVHKLLGVTVFQGRLGMVSEWMSNGNLREYIKKNPTTNRQPLCIQAASGVDYLHRKDTVHGDIKACNFLVSRDGVVKLTDFDHSIMMDCSVGFTATSRVGGGTLRWMAPELLIREDSHQRNKRTDIYALGMTFLEIMTGRVPYELECPNEGLIVMKLLNKVLPKRTEHFEDDEWGNGLWNLLVRCWDQDPHVRPSAEDLNTSILGLLSSA